MSQRVFPFLLAAVNNLIADPRGYRGKVFDARLRSHPFHVLKAQSSQIYKCNFPSARPEYRKTRQSETDTRGNSRAIAAARQCNPFTDVSFVQPTFIPRDANFNTKKIAVDLQRA